MSYPFDTSVAESPVNIKVSYAVDVTIVADSTGSMTHLIENVKTMSVGFHQRIMDKMREQGKTIDQLRTRLIAYRDYYASEDDPSGMMVCTPFFKMPEEESKFVELVHSIRATGGGDLPESGLEALALAIKSPWETKQEFSKFRHLIVVFTDADAHPLEKGDKPVNYPKDMPRNLDELVDLWFTQMDSKSRRLALFTPDVVPWNIFETGLDNTIHRPSLAGSGLQEVSLDEIIEFIVNSI